MNNDSAEYEARHKVQESMNENIDKLGHVE